MTTKAELQARVEELEALLAATAHQPEAGMVRLVGMLRGVRRIGADIPDRPIAASAILANTASVRGKDGQDIKVDLPIDSLVARDNGLPIASELLELARTTQWARVAVYGYWAVFGEVGRNERGYPVAQRRQLRVMRFEVLNSAPQMEEDLSLPPINRSNQDQFAPF